METDIRVSEMPIDGLTDSAVSVPPPAASADSLPGAMRPVLSADSLPGAMLSADATARLVPLDSLWAGSVKTVWEPVPVPAGSGTQGFPIWIMLCLALLMVPALVRRVSFSWLAPVKLPAIRSEHSRPGLLVFVTVFCCFLLTGSLCSLHLLNPERFVTTSFMLTAAVALKCTILALMGRRSGRECFVPISRATMILICITAFEAAALALAAVLLKAPAGGGMPAAAGILALQVSLAAVAGLTALIYLWRVALSLFSSGITPFYSFLYLCALEFIPGAAMTVMLTRL